MQAALNIQIVQRERRSTMRIGALSVLLFLLCAPSAVSQRLVIEVTTMEGQLLQTIDGEQDAAKRLVLLEDFAKKFPNHEAVTWVLSHIQQHYLTVKQYDKVFEAGTKL